MTDDIPVLSVYLNIVCSYSMVHGKY